MSTVVPAPKFVREYQPKDEFGNSLGPPQRFEGDTAEELADKLAAAHENASVALYRTKKAVKLGTLLDPDPDDPLPTFEEQILSADDRVAISNALNDPNSSPDAVKRLLKSFGIAVEDIRSMLAEHALQKRIRRGQEQTQAFLEVHPEYIQADANRDVMLRYLEKRGLAITKKNLEIAYEDLRSEGLLITQVTSQAKTEVPAPPAPVAPAEQAPAPAAAEVPAPSPAIPETATPAAPISAPPPATPRPTISSSGLSRENASVTPTPSAPKAKGISAQDITAMNSEEYAYALKNGLWEFQVDANKKKVPVRQLMTSADFRAAVEELYKR